jgi:tetratricopeptide (TPR) repeat protein
MSVTVAKSRLIVSSKFAELYQQISSYSDFQKLGQRLMAYAETAQNFRHTERLESLGTILSNLPIKEYQHIGQYYLAWCGYRKGQNTQISLETVVDHSNSYRAKAFLLLAGMETAKGDYPAAIRFYQDAVKWSQNLSTIVSAAKGIAVFKANEGSHNTAIKELEALYPITRYINDRIYYDYLNSYAVELGEAGRIEEALKVSRITLASPFAFAYPEWRETGQDLALRGYRSRSSVPIIQSFPGNIVQMPQREPSATRTHPAIFGPAPVRSLEKWKEKKMVKEPNGEDKIDTKKMSERELILKIIELSSNENITEGELREILDAVIKITSKRR